MKIIFATNNPHKAKEVRLALPAHFDIVTLKEAGIDVDIPEPHDTLEANAEEKAMTIYRLTGTDCFSEDTGLEVSALNGEPGVRSARYAGEGNSSRKNIDKLLRRLEGVRNRNARFRTVVCLVINGGTTFFEGVCEGRITETQKGEEGFGYDPVFIPEGAGKTFAAMGIAEKNVYSHRRKAVEKLVEHLAAHGGKAT